MNDGTEKNDDIWIQCDNPHCMKWRKVNHGHWKNLMEIEWFCHMNKDTLYNNCDISQQKMIVPQGETVVFSELDVGTLVWAKMSGYPRWPAIISPDPGHETGQHVIRYQDGTNDTRYYHVEFLGSPHTHAWISTSFVEVYHLSNPDIIFTEKSMRFKKAKEQFQKSCIEASLLMNMSLKERVKSCVYQWTLPSKGDISSSVSLPPPPKRSIKALNNRKIKTHENVFVHKYAFWKSFNGFQRKTNCDVPQSIKWKKQEIDVFSFFQKVHFAGGYKEAVSHILLWRNICCDLIGKPHEESRFLSLRRAYEEFLLPFEESLISKGIPLQYKEKSNELTTILSAERNRNNQESSVPKSSCSKKRKNKSILTKYNRRWHNLSPKENSKESPDNDKIKKCQESPIHLPEKPPCLINKNKRAISPNPPTESNTGHNKNIPESPISLPEKLCLVKETEELASPIYSRSCEDITISKGDQIPTASKNGLDIVIDELDNLDEELECCDYSSTECNFYDSQMTLFDESVPLLDPPNDGRSDFCDVIDELADLEDTLLEMTKDVLSAI